MDEILKSARHPPRHRGRCRSFAGYGFPGHSGRAVGGRFDSQTGPEIHQAAWYIYHRGAASLRMRQSHAIGLIVSDITNPFFAEVIVAIEERLATARLVTLLGNTSEDRAKEERCLKTMREFPADGILICPAIRPRSPELTSRILRVNFRLSLLPGAPLASIMQESITLQGALLAVEHLCSARQSPDRFYRR